MIVTAILSLVAGLLEGLIGALPVFEVPDWLTAAGPMIADLLGATGVFSAWVPVALLLTVAAAVLASMAAGMALRSLRMVLSFFTGGGGS